MHMQSLLRKRRIEAAQIQIARQSFSRDRKNASHYVRESQYIIQPPISLLSPRLYSAEVEKVVVVVVHRREIAHSPHLEVKLRERGLLSNVEEFLQFILGLDWRRWGCCKPL